jgi:hypothetical protein
MNNNAMRRIERYSNFSASANQPVAGPVCDAAQSPHFDFPPSLELAVLSI